MADFAQSILKKAPPADMEQNLKYFKEKLKNNPDALEALGKKFPLPLKVYDPSEVDESDRPFLMCRYNRVGGDNKHRSPWTNKLYPGADVIPDTAAADAADTKGLAEIRLFESKFNEVWDAYKNLYYGHLAVGSVFLFPGHDSDAAASGAPGGAAAAGISSAFMGVFGVHKSCDFGSWDSLHIVYVDALEEGAKMCQYRVESTILMIIDPEINGKDDKTTSMDISASMSKETSRPGKIQRTMLASCHIENIGKIIEANEIDLRSSIERVHVPKTQEILDNIQDSETNTMGMPTQFNPIMGMMRESEAFKKKMNS